MNWEHRAAAAIRSRSDVLVLRERSDVVVRYLLGRSKTSDPDLAGALIDAGVDADRAKVRCREMLDTALFTQGSTPEEILGVRRGTPVEDIRSQYKRLVQLYHPDRDSEFDEDLSSDRLTRLRKALEQLLDPNSRDTAPNRSEHRSRNTVSRSRARTTPGSRHATGASSNFDAGESGYDLGANRGSQSGRSESPRTRTKSSETEQPSPVSERLLKKVRDKHRPESSQISFVLFVLAGIAAVFYYLVNDPCAVKGDCDEVASLSSSGGSVASVNGVEDPLLLHPDIKTLIGTYANAYTTKNLTLLIQQFAPGAIDNGIVGIADITTNYKQVFSASSGPRSLDVRTIHKKDDGSFSIEGSMVDHSTTQDGAIEINRMPF